ncbi:unnamed protein product [Caenorhabditis nigoni]
MDPNQEPNPVRPRIKILDFPRDLQDEIIQNMNFLELFGLSISRAFRRNVKRARYWTSLSLELHEDREKDFIEVLNNSTREEKILLHNAAVTREHLVHDKLVVEHSVRDLSEKIKSDIEDPRERVLHHLLETFQFKSKTLTCNRVIDEQNDSFLWNSIPKFDYVYLSRGCIFSDEYITMTPAEIELFFKKIRSSHYIVNTNVDDKNYKFQKAIGCQTLRLFFRSEWLELDNILTREENLYHIQLNKLSDGQANSLLKQWINGCRSNSLSMDLSAEHTFSDAETFKNIKLTAWKPIENDKDPYNLGVDGKIAYFRRKCDGKLASVENYSKSLVLQTAFVEELLSFNL